MGTFTREDVRFTSGDDECGAWFYRPEGEGPFPVVVLCHGLGAKLIGPLAVDELVDEVAVPV